MAEGTFNINREGAWKQKGNKKNQCQRGGTKPDTVFAFWIDRVHLKNILGPKTIPLTETEERKINQSRVNKGRPKRV